MSYGIGLFFYSKNPGADTFYEIMLFDAGSRLYRWTAGVRVFIGGFGNPSFGSNTWYRVRITYWLAGGKLYCKFEKSVSPFTTWTQIGTELVDETPLTSNSTDDIGVGFAYGASGQNLWYDQTVLNWP